MACVSLGAWAGFGSMLWVGGLRRAGDGMY